MFLGIHTPAYSLIAQLDPTQRCFHHNSESQWSTCLMLFQLDFGGMVCGFQRNSGERKVCLVLVPALAGFMRGWAGWGTGAGRDGLAGWSQEHPQLDVLLSQLHSPTAAQSALCTWHSFVPSCSPSMDSSSALSFPIPCLCLQVFIS